MPLVMKEDVTFDPIDVSLFRSNAVMLHPEDFAHLIEQFGQVRDFTTKSGFIPRIRG